MGGRGVKPSIDISFTHNSKHFEQMSSHFDLYHLYDTGQRWGRYFKEVRVSKDTDTVLADLHIY